MADNRHICPTGWHEPSDTEWNVLIGYLDPFYVPNSSGTQSSIAGNKMKSTGTQFWASPNAASDNSSGFSGLPGGVRFSYGPFYNIGGLSYWWCSTQDNLGNAWSRYLSYSDGNILRNGGNMKDGFSVRCIKD